jgi:DnaJ-class molecular chaperone
MSTMMCPNCSGTGLWNGKICEVCNGLQKVPSAQFIPVRCQCDWPLCNRWQVRGIAGEAKFDAHEARVVARVLNMVNACESELTRSLMEASIIDRLRD